jgi:CheY-like chemotaxis protein
LIADANVDAAESLALLLRLHGHDVATAYTGPEALAAANAARSEAVFLSIDLPGLDGYEVCRRLRTEFAGNGSILLIALTGYGQEDDRRETTAAGFDHHFTKPADPGTLLALLD